MDGFERYIKKCDLSLKDDEIITYDNEQALGKFIALLAIKFKVVFRYINKNMQHEEYTIDFGHQNIINE